MASVSTRIRHRPERGWTVRVYYNGQKWEKGGFGQGEEGRERAETWAAELAAGNESKDRWEHPRPGQHLPVDQLCRDWIVAHGGLRSERTQLTDQGRVERLAHYFGDRDARGLREGDCRQFAADVLAEGRSAGLAQGCLSTLRRVLNLAVKAGLLERNPVPEIAAVMRDCGRRAATEETQADAWSREEVDTLLDLAGRYEPHLYPALLFAFHTGARRGEIIALRWEDIDFGAARVRFRRTARLYSKGTKLPKAGKGRVMPLSPLCIAMLERHRERRGEVAVTQLHAPPEWVFPSPRGKLWKERNLERAWYRLRARAQQRGVRPLKLHCARHTFITWALEGSTAPARVALWVGCSEDVIRRHYAHVIPDRGDDLGFLDGVAGQRRDEAGRATSGGDGNSVESMATRAGFEPATPSSGGWCSIQLSYRAAQKLWWGVLDSNQ